MRFCFLILTTALLSGGCIIRQPTPPLKYYTPSSTEIANADYGPYPSNYDEIARVHLQPILKDPQSAQYREYASPKKYWVSRTTHADYGYGVCYYINSKNSFGGYTGERVYFFLINNGKVIQYRREGRRKDFPPSLRRFPSLEQEALNEVRKVLLWCEQLSKK